MPGTTDIVATPHANGQYQFDPTTIDRRIAELQAHSEVRIPQAVSVEVDAADVRPY